MLDNIFTRETFRIATWQNNGNILGILNAESRSEISFEKEK